MAKSQKTTTREKRKPKSADAKSKSKVPRYLGGGSMSASSSLPLKPGQKK